MLLKYFSLPHILLSPLLQFQEDGDYALRFVGEAVFDADGHFVVLGAEDHAVGLHFLEGGGEHGVCDAVDASSEFAVADYFLLVDEAEDQDLPLTSDEVKDTL